MYVTLLIFGVCLGSVVSMTTTPKPTHTPRPTMPRPDLETELTNRGTYTVLLDLLRTAGLLQTLKSADHMTLFAPTDDAFSHLPAHTLDALKADSAKLQDVLGYHAVLGTELALRGHIQDTVLMSSNQKPIRINIYGLVHVIAAEGVNTTERNIHVANGYVHGLDTPMTPPEGSVMDTLSSRSDISTLVSLLQTAGLVDKVQADMNITVFAPTNDAFGKVDPQVMAYLSAHPKDLIDTLMYHVVSRLTMYTIGMKHSMIIGSADTHHDKLMVLEDHVGGISINDAKILERDISANNGVVHVIDKVLIPTRVLIHMEAEGVSLG